MFEKFQVVFVIEYILAVSGTTLQNYNLLIYLNTIILGNSFGLLNRREL